jgi:dolichol-phosphate mannosyltransferase
MLHKQREFPLDAVLPDVSILVPTINEAENLPLLTQRIAAAMAGRSYEIIIIDDNSQDGTAGVCRELAAKYPLRLLVREHPRDGLSGAVLHGIAAAQGATFVVMDADLQHPPESIPLLLAALDGGADFALGSRHIAGGSTDTTWGVLRRINSTVATLLARPFAPGVTDPMAGFFALRRTTFQGASQLTPLGYKIALELMCKCRVKALKEVPIHFALRNRGQSKLSLKQQFRYLEHLSRLYDFTFPRLSPVVKFLIATAIGWLAGAAMFGLLRWHGTPGPASAAAAWGAVIVATWLFHLRYVRTQRQFLPRPAPWRDFVLISAVEWLACILTAAWLGHRLTNPPPSDIESLAIPFTVATSVRYVLRKELLQDIRGLRRDAPCERRVA